VTYFTMPGGVEVQLYEPKYTKRKAKPAKAAKAVKRSKASKPKKPAKGKGKAAPSRKRR
jgi:hypothetical protein